MAHDPAELDPAELDHRSPPARPFRHWDWRGQLVCVGAPPAAPVPPPSAAVAAPGTPTRPAGAGGLFALAGSPEVLFGGVTMPPTTLLTYSVPEGMLAPLLARGGRGQSAEACMQAGCVVASLARDFAADAQTHYAQGLMVVRMAFPMDSRAEALAAVLGVPAAGGPG